MSKYSKTIAALAAFVALVGQALADSTIDGGEWGALGTAAVGVVLVFAVRNRPAGPEPIEAAVVDPSAAHEFWTHEGGSSDG